jgi:hypothetical protein
MLEYMGNTRNDARGELVTRNFQTPHARQYCLGCYILYTLCLYIAVTCVIIAAQHRSEFSARVSCLFSFSFENCKR